MSESISISSGIADRYATAVFDLSKDEKLLGELEAGNDVLDGGAARQRRPAHDDCLATLFAEPNRAQLSPGLQKSLDCRRFAAEYAVADGIQTAGSFVLPQLVSALRERIAEEKGEVTAEVRSATALTDTQLEELKGVIGKSVGKDVKLNTSVDESLIGGLVVKVGSKMIDTSIRSKLNALQNTMKEVG